jgi:hypothetical protein
MVRVEFTGSFGFRLSLLEKPSSGLLIAFLMDSHVMKLQNVNAVTSAVVNKVLTARITMLVVIVGTIIHQGVATVLLLTVLFVKMETD